MREFKLWHVSKDPGGLGNLSSVGGLHGMLWHFSLLVVAQFPFPAIGWVQRRSSPLRSSLSLRTW